MEDDGFNVVAQLPNLKAQKEALTSKKDVAVKAKDEADVKVEQLLKYKTKLKKLHQQVESDLTSCELQYLTLRLKGMLSSVKGLISLGSTML